MKDETSTCPFKFFLYHTIIIQFYKFTTRAVCLDTCLNFLISRMRSVNNEANLHIKLENA